MDVAVSQDAMRRRFQQAPFVAMIEALLVSTARTGGQHRLIHAGCGHLVNALQLCRGAANDNEARDKLAEVGRLLSMPGVTEAAVHSFVGEEQGMILDIREAISRFVQPMPQINHDARAPGIAWPPASPPSSPPAPVIAQAPPPAPPPMQFVHAPIQLGHEGPMMPMPMPTAVPVPTAMPVPTAITVPTAVPVPTSIPVPSASEVPLEHVHVDNDVEVDASTPAKMRTPSKRKPKTTPRRAH